MNSNRSYKTIPILLRAIDIPESAYETARARYEDIGQWLCRPESSCRIYSPTVFSQGSFALGTVTRPYDIKGEYDLDLVVRLDSGISKTSHSQRQLKSLIGIELNAYRRARQIEKAIEEKRRCWRLNYKDQISFHIDILPCIPEDESQRANSMRRMVAARTINEVLAEEIARESVSITDNHRHDYEFISADWNVSNPRGYARWFASRVILAKETIRNRLRMERKASVEQIPRHRLKAPLQRCVQLLKVHRDRMFRAAPDQKPISIIITTLAAKAYQGQEDVTEALVYIVNNMASYLSPMTPIVPNPVNPEEDFADKWNTQRGLELDLRGNFHRWLQQAKADFGYLAGSNSTDDIVRKAQDSLGLSLDPRKVQQGIGGRIKTTTPPAIIMPAHTIKDPPRPWMS